MAVSRFPPMYIVSAMRTAFGTFGGALKNKSATDLATHAAKAAIASANVAPEKIESIIIGNVQQTDSNAAYLARHVGLQSGVPVPTPALGVNRLCGSGFQAVVSGCQELLVGDASIVLAGGTESMSQAPHAVRGIRWGTTLGVDVPMEDTLWAGLTDNYAGLPMGVTAENLAEQYDITRDDSDAFALQSQQRWAAADFSSEIAPWELKTRKGTTVFEVDEHARPQTTIEDLQKLPTVFKKNGTVTAGAASGICDGAAAMVLATADAVESEGLKPMARIVDWHVSGVDPTVMGIGPAPAIKALLEKTGLSLDDIAEVEVNEAFAPQVLAVQRELGIDGDKLNPCGGAIALGHPLGASGARITAHLANRLNDGKIDGKYAIGSACIGGGQGIAVLLESV